MSLLEKKEEAKDQAEGIHDKKRERKMYLLCIP
jgi:hypothetical protein